MLKILLDTSLLGPVPLLWHVESYTYSRIAMFCALLAADILFHKWTILHWIGQLLNCSRTCSWNGHKALSLSWGTTTTDTLSHCYWTVVITFPQKVCEQQSIYIYTYIYIYASLAMSIYFGHSCLQLCWRSNHTDSVRYQYPRTSWILYLYPRWSACLSLRPFTSAPG